MSAVAPFGPGFSPEQVRQAGVMEIYGTHFEDPNEECVFVLRDNEGVVIGEERMVGY